MSEIAGILNFKRDISDDVSIRKMSKIQELNAANNCGMFFSKECNLIENSFKNENKKLNVYTCRDSRYVILIDGELYNHELHSDFNKIVSLVKKLKILF